MCKDLFGFSGKKAMISHQNRFFLTSKQHFAIHFSLLNCNVCPLAIPEILAQTQESYYRQLIHSGFSCTVKNWRKSRCKQFSQVLIQEEVTVWQMSDKHQMIFSRVRSLIPDHQVDVDPALLEPVISRSHGPVNFLASKYATTASSV